MAELFYNGIGFVGMGLFLLAYLMINLGRWDAGDWRPHLLNLLGALAIMVSLIHAWNLPIFVMECFWGAISLYGLYRAYRIRA